MTESGAKNGVEEDDPLVAYLRGFKKKMDAPDSDD